MNNKSNETISIEYGQVNSTVEKLRSDAARVDSNFDQYGESIRRAGADDVFFGDSSETFRASYNRLKPKLDEYVDLINQFANILSGASSDTASGESKINQASQTLG